MRQIAEWLAKIGLERYTPAFIDNDIDVEVLRYLTDADLGEDCCRKLKINARVVTMQIIDAQIHLWATGLPSNQSHWQVTHFTAEEATVLMDEGGVDAAVIHPPEWDSGSTELA